MFARMHTSNYCRRCRSSLLTRQPSSVVVIGAPELSTVMVSAPRRAPMEQTMSILGRVTRTVHPRSERLHVRVERALSGR